MASRYAETAGACEALMERALALHAAGPVIDFHAHPMFNVMFYGKDLRRRHQPAWWWNPFANHIDLPRMKEGRLSTGAVTLYGVWAPWRPFDTFPGIVKHYHAFLRFREYCGDAVVHARTGQEMRAAFDQGRPAFYLSVESGRAIGTRLDRLAWLARRGARYLTITHFVPNRLGMPFSWPGSAKRGLTPLGFEAIAEMNRLGMLVDVAHCSEKAFEDVLKTTSLPPVCTHVGLRTLRAARRNLTDDQVKQIAGAGGVIGVISFPDYLEKGRWFWPRGRMSAMLDVYCRIAEIAGTDCLALGTDMDGFIYTPRDLPDISHLPKLTAGLLARGFSDADVRKILGGNLLRIFDAADKIFGTNAFVDDDMASFSPPD